MACNPDTTITNIQMSDLNTNIDVFNEVLTSNQELTPTSASDGEKKRTIEGLTQNFLSAIQSAGGVPLGVWASGVTEFNNYNEYAVYNGIPYKPKATTTLPYTAQGADPTVAPDADNVQPFSEISTLNLGSYTDLVYSSIDDMISGAGIESKIGDACLADGKLWKRVSISSPPTIADFTRLDQSGAYRGTQNSVDIFVGYGQSNAKGSASNSEGALSFNTEFVKVYDGSGLIDMTSYTPTQNDGKSTGSMWPAFFNQFNSLSGRRAIFANCANSSESILDLSKGQANTNYSGMVDWVNEIKALIAANGDTVGNVYIVFWQGERDAQLETGPTTYKSLINQLWTDIKADTGATSFNVITVGSYTLTTVRQSIPIQKIQREWARENDDVKIIFDEEQSLGSQDMKVDTVHLNQRGYNFVGTRSASNFVESNIYTNAQASRANLLRYGKINLDQSQDWEMYGGVLRKTATQTWELSVNADRAKSGIFSINDNGTDLEITVADGFDYYIESTALSIGDTNVSAYLRPKIKSDLATNKDVDGRSIVTVEFFADVKAVIDMGTLSVNTGLQDGLLSSLIGVTSPTVGRVDVTYPEAIGAVTACPSGDTPRMISCSPTSSTESDIRMYDASGSLVNDTFTATIPDMKINTDNININYDLLIKVVATKKVTV